MGPCADPLAIVRDASVVLVSHDLSQTGSPLLLTETAVRLRDAGARVRIATIADDAAVYDLPGRQGIALLPIVDSFAECAGSDLVIANTAEASFWVDGYLRAHPDAGRSLIWWLHEMDASSYAGRISSLGRASMAIFDSGASLRSWKDAGVVLPPVSSVLHLCVWDALVADASRRRLASRTDGVREELGIGPDDFAITLIGTYAPHKGQDLLMRTVGRMMAALPDLPLKVILVGFPNEEGRLDFLHRFSGPAQNALDDRRAVTIVTDVAPYYAASDAFVMNTQGFGENFGRVTIEAMAFGLPVLGTDAGGTPEIVRDGITGLLHPVGAAGQDRLAENILALLRDRPKARAMGQAGLKRVRERFSSVRFLSELGSLLDIALSNGAART